MNEASAVVMDHLKFSWAVLLGYQLHSLFIQNSSLTCVFKWILTALHTHLPFADYYTLNRTLIFLSRLAFPFQFFTFLLTIFPFIQVSSFVVSFD